MPEPIREIGECLGPQRAAIRRHVFGSSPQTLIHRDFQLDNLVFGGPNGGATFAVLDWQLASCGRKWDAAYFLSENLTEEARRAVGTDLLRPYWQALTEHGVQGYTFDHCLLDYRYCLLQRFNVDFHDCRHAFLRGAAPVACGCCRHATARLSWIAAWELLE